MLIRFLVDYRGVLSAEQYYLAGSEVEFDAATAAQLVAAGRAEPAEQAVPATRAVVSELPRRGSPRKKAG